MRWHDLSYTKTVVGKKRKSYPIHTVLRRFVGRLERSLLCLSTFLILGATKENDGVSIINSLAKNILGKDGCFTIQNTSNSEVTIPAGQRGLRCAILIVGCNTQIPSIFVLSRTALRGTIFEGDIKPSDITVNSNGSVSVKKNAALSLYYRYILMEW